MAIKKSLAGRMNEIIGGAASAKSNAEAGLQNFGKNVVRPTIKNILMDPSKRPEATGKALKRIKYEGS